MSVQSIDNALITQYSAMLRVQSQQIRSRLRPLVEVRPMVGDLFAYDGVGSVEAREINGRNVPATFDDIEHKRRKIKRRRFVVNLPIDAHDVRGSLLDPQGIYARSCIFAMERVFDRVGVQAAFADVETGRDFGTVVTFANDGGRTVNATAGLTYEKILEINKNFHNDEVGTEIVEKQAFLATGTEEEALFKEIELTSGDFSRQFAVDNGKLVSAVGNQLVVYGASVPNPILAVSVGGVRDCIALTGRGLTYGLNKDMSISIQPRSDYIETTQVQIIMAIGAVRTEGAHIQKVQTTA